MGKRSAATIGTIVGLAIVFAAVGVAATAQFDLLNWDAIFTYDLDDQSEDPIDFTESGTYTDTIDCDGHWDLISSSNDTTTNSDDVIEYAIDASAGEIGYFERINGSEKVREYACNIYTAPTANQPLSNWARDEECKGNPSAEDRDDDNADNTPTGLAPGDLEMRDKSARDPGEDDCVVAAGAAAGNTNANIPYTGRTTAWLEDSNGDKSTQAVHDVLAGVPFGGEDDGGDKEFSGVNCTSSAVDLECAVFARKDSLDSIGPVPQAIGHFKGWTEFQ